jgi:hypothetical protein
MIQITSAENARNIKYSINALGELTVYTIGPKVDSTKESLTGGSIIATPFKAKDYQNSLASLLVQSDKVQNAININYISYPKTVQKPNKFEVESKRLLTF